LPHAPRHALPCKIVDRIDSDSIRQMPELFVASPSSRGWSDHTSLASELLVIETPAGRLENRCETLKDTLRLGHDTSLDHLARGRVLADLTAEVKETTDFDRL
jgi:hypothetical protein